MRTIFIIFLSAFCMFTYGQNYALQSKTNFINYLKRVYEVEQNIGCRVYEIDSKKVLITVVSVKSSPNSQRVGEIKALRAASEYLKGSRPISFRKIETDSVGEVIGQPVDNIITVSSNVIDKMEILTTFKDKDRTVFIYNKELATKDDLNGSITICH